MMCEASYVSGCDSCIRRKGPLKVNKAPIQMVRSGYPLEIIAIDILGELTQIKGGNK